MLSKLKKISAALALVVTHSAAMAAPIAIEVIPYGDVVGSGLITFTGLGAALPGTNYDNILSVNGVSFGERFVGQTLSFFPKDDSEFDVLSDAPSNGLTLVAGETNQNLVVILDDGVRSEVLSGLGPREHPSVDAIGEGAFAVKFDRPQAKFGFRLAGVAGGTATISFFQADGTLIDTLELKLRSLDETQYDEYGFRREGRVEDIAGFSVFNNDPGGIGLDDLKFTPRNGQPVPEPGSIALIGIALALLAGGRRRA